MPLLPRRRAVSCAAAVEVGAELLVSSTGPDDARANSRCGTAGKTGDRGGGSSAVHGCGTPDRFSSSSSSKHRRRTSSSVCTVMPECALNMAGADWANFPSCCSH